MRIVQVLAAALFLVAFSAVAAVGDLAVNVTVPNACADGDQNLSLCPVDEYRLYVDGALHGTVTAGPNTVSGVTLSNGEHTFRVDTVGPGGTTTGDSVALTVSDYKPGGKVTITVTFDCGSCVVTQ